MSSRREFTFEFIAIPIYFVNRELESIEREIFRGINVQRAGAGVGPLEWSDGLCKTSREHSRRMIEAGFFGHDDPKWGSLRARMDAAGVMSLRCGENVFRESRFPDPAALAVVAWMYSEGHRTNLLTPEYTFTGVGAAFGPRETVAVTQQFMLPYRCERVGKPCDGPALKRGVIAR